MPSKHHVFRPQNEPARSIYDAFERASTQREQRPSNWESFEREQVFLEAQRQSVKLNLRPVTMDDVIAAENHAMGHADYGSQWARGIVDRMYGQ